MNIQYISDLHLEFYDGEIDPEQFVTPVAPYLVLAGDIGIPERKNYSAFLRWCSDHWKHVFVVAGNHEYYSKTVDMPTKLQRMREICGALPTVSFLDCDTVLLPEHNLRILGCTLWSFIPDNVKEKAVQYMNDTNHMYKSPTEHFTPWDMTEAFAKQRVWLSSEIDKCAAAKERCLVVTHYLPLYSLIAEQYKGHLLNACFASDCEDLLRPPVCGWICGHTHTGMAVTIQGIPCCINPYGYPREDVETRCKTATLHLEN